MIKKKGIFVKMSEEDLEAYDNARRGKTHREALLHGVGIDAKPRQRGRPRFKFAKERKLDVGFKFGKDKPLRNIRCEGCGYYYKSDAAPGGSICSRCGYNSAEIRKTFRRITCSTCGMGYYTAREKGASSCWKCGSINTEITPFEWKMPKKGVTRGKYDFANAHLSNTSRRDFNEDEMKRQNAKMAKDREDMEV